MTNKKLGLLLAPLIPLTAIGVVELARAVTAMTQPVQVVEMPPRGDLCGYRRSEPRAPIETPPPPPPQGLETA